jgi:hypothetical protein
MIDFTDDQLMELQGILVDEYSREQRYVEADEASCRTTETGMSTKAYGRLHRLKSIWESVNTELHNRQQLNR